MSLHVQLVTPAAEWDRCRADKGYFNVGGALIELDYRLVMDTFADAVIATDGRGQIVYVNGAAETLLGWPKGELAGQPLTAIIPARLHASHSAGFERYLSTRTPQLIGRAARVPARRRDGSEVEVELTLATFRVGEDDLFVGSLRHQSDRVELEPQIAVTGYLRAATAAAAQLTTHLDLEEILDTATKTLATEFDAALARIWLYDAAENALILRASAGLSTATTTSCRARIAVGRDPCRVAEVLRTRRPLIVTEPLDDPQFDQEWVRREKIAAVAVFPLLAAEELRGVMACFSQKPLLPEAAEVLATFASMVTASLNHVQLFAREQAALEALQASESQLQLVTDAVPVLISYVDTQGRYRWNNRAYETWFGRPRSEIKGRHLREMLSEVAFEAIRPHVEAALTGQEVTYEQEAPFRDGGIRYFRASYIPHRGADGKVLGFVALVHDLTERKRMEEAQRFMAEASGILAASLDYQTTLDQVARLAVPRLADWCVVYLKEADGTIRQLAVAHVHPAKVDLAWDLERRYPVDPRGAGVLATVVRTGQSQLLPEIPDDVLAASTRDAEHLRIVRQLGFRSAILAPLIAREQILGALAFGSAESGRRYGPADLALAEELAGRSALAIDNARLHHDLEVSLQEKDAFLAMLGHELRTPLSAAHMTLRLIQAKTPGDSGLEPLRARVERQIHRMARLVDDLQDVSRLSRGMMSLRRERLDLARLVRETAEDYRGTLEEKGLTFRVQVPPEPFPVEGDPTRLAQVLVNLLHNATKFTDSGGTVGVRVFRHSHAQAGPSGTPEHRNTEHVVVTVTDTGIGFDPALLPRLFESFSQAEQSLDRSRGGLGLGLALAKGLVELHGGEVSAQSAGPGQGAAFSFRLPLAVQETERA